MTFLLIEISITIELRSTLAIYTKNVFVFLKKKEYFFKIRYYIERYLIHTKVQFYSCGSCNS